ncbi:hypothetical protein LUZ60_004513 [Juncus effusus]|nr:hypothetical protein LUZ60_004513 [Juncus effusus]
MRKITLGKCKMQDTRVASPHSSEEESLGNECTKDEREVAKSLILMSEGFSLPHYNPAPHDDSTSPIQINGPNKTKNNCLSRKLDQETGLVVYECNTCNKRFGTFQALGGHHAGHKKIKLGPPTVECRPTNEFYDMNNLEEIKDEEETQMARTSSFPKAGAETRVHRCLVCGDEYKSGQALGGHMRKHRSLVIAPRPETITTEENKETKNEASPEITKGGNEAEHKMVASTLKMAPESESKEEGNEENETTISPILALNLGLPAQALTPLV